MNVVQVCLPYPADGADYIELIPISDAHIGDPHSDLSLLKETIAEIKSKPNAYTILNGDLINNATKTSPSDVYSETLSPMAQLEMAVELLMPIKDRILCIQDGNHERRAMKTDGINISKVIALQLGLADRYSDGMTFLFIRFPSEYRRGTSHRRCPSVYRILCTHGSGGGRTAGAKVNKMTQLVSIADADIYLYSHTHYPAVVKQGFLRVEPRQATLKNVERTFVNTGAYVEYGGYGEQYEFVPPSLSHPHIFLNVEKPEVKAAL